MSKKPYRKSSSVHSGNNSVASTNISSFKLNQSQRNNSISQFQIGGATQADQLRNVVENAWPTKVNKSKVQEEERVQQKVVQLTQEAFQNQEEINELRMQIQEQGVDIKLGDQQVRDYYSQIMAKELSIDLLKRSIQQLKKQIDQLNEQKVELAEKLNQPGPVPPTIHEIAIQCEDDRIQLLEDAVDALVDQIDGFKMRLLGQDSGHKKNEDGEEAKIDTERTRAETEEQKIESEEDFDQIMDKELTLEQQLEQEQQDQQEEKQLHEKIQEQMQKMEELEQLQQNQVVNLNQEIDVIRVRLDRTQFRSSQVFWILPGYQIDNTFQYPDVLTLQERSVRELQPLQLGFKKFSLVAKFGDLDRMLIGVDQDKQYNNLTLSLDQLNEEQKVSVIQYTWKLYENNENILFFYRIRFYNNEQEELASIQNITDSQFQRAVAKGNFKFISKKVEDCSIAEDEIIAAIKFGMRKSQSLVNFQFILKKF